MGNTALRRNHVVQAGSAHRGRPKSRDYGGDARSLELAESMVSRHEVISRNEGAMLREIAEYDQAEAWRGEGFLSMEAWLAGRCRMSDARARTLVSTARRTEELPELAGALTDGRLTLDVVAPLAAVATPANDASLAEKASQWTPKQARQAAADLRGATKARSAAAFGRRCVRFNDERASLWAQLTPDAYALVKSALVGRARRHDHPSASDPDYTEFQSRCADALVEFCAGRPSNLQGDSTAGPGGQAGRSTDETRSTRSYAPRASMVVHVDLDRLLHGDRYGEAAIEWVGPISADVARRLACNADITLSFESPGGTVLDQKSLERDPTPAQRIAVHRRDGGCRMTGCGSHTLTDVHHMKPVEEGGRTELSNLITLCVPHHSRVHELGWTMEGDAQGEVRFISPHGQVLRSTPVRPWEVDRE
jgi:hypothetical protein